MLAEGMTIQNGEPNGSEYEPKNFLQRLRDNLTESGVLDPGWANNVIRHIEEYIAEGSREDDKQTHTERCRQLERNIKFLFGCYRPDKQTPELYLYPDLTEFITEQPGDEVYFELISLDEQGHKQNLVVQLSRMLFQTIGGGSTQYKGYGELYANRSIETMLMGIHYAVDPTGAHEQKPLRLAIASQRGWEGYNPERNYIVQQLNRKAREAAGEFFWDPEHLHAALETATRVQEVNYYEIKQELISRHPELENMLGEPGVQMTKTQMSRISNLVSYLRRDYTEIMPIPRKEFDWEGLSAGKLGEICDELITKATYNTANPSGVANQFTIDELRRLVLANSGNKRIYEAISLIVFERTGFQLGLEAVRAKLRRAKGEPVPQVVYLIADRLGIERQHIDSEWEIQRKFDWSAPGVEEIVLEVLEQNINISKIMPKARLLQEALNKSGLFESLPELHSIRGYLTRRLQS